MNFYAQKGTSKIRSDKFLYDTYFTNIEDGISMEAGAMDGITINMTKTLEEIGWTTINIEPNPDSYSRLIVNRQGPKNINYNCALSNVNGKATLSLIDDSHLSDGRDGRLLGSKLGENNGTIHHKIQTRTYKEIIEEIGIDHLNLFVLDVEGYEEKAIKGMRNCKILPDVFCIENVNKEINLENIIKNVFGNYYRLDSKQKWDIIFVKSQ